MRVGPMVGTPPSAQRLIDQGRLKAHLRDRPRGPIGRHPVASCGRFHGISRCVNHTRRRRRGDLKSTAEAASATISQPRIVAGSLTRYWSSRAVAVFPNWSLQT